MKRWAALALVLALCALMPRPASGQQPEPRGRKAGALGRNYPNPFNPETVLSFSVGDEGCNDNGRLYRVSVRIYNVLAQPVGIPLLEAPTSTGATSSDKAGQPVVNLMLTCGAYTARWDGKFMNTGREVASGVYLWELVVDGQRVGARKMLVAK